MKSSLSSVEKRVLWEILCCWPGRIYSMSSFNAYTSLGNMPHSNPSAIINSARSIPNLDFQIANQSLNTVEREQENIELRKIYQWINELSWYVALDLWLKIEVVKLCCSKHTMDEDPTLGYFPSNFIPKKLDYNFELLTEYNIVVWRIIN